MITIPTTTCTEETCCLPSLHKSFFFHVTLDNQEEESFTTNCPARLLSKLSYALADAISPAGIDHADYIREQLQAISEDLFIRLQREN